MSRKLALGLVLCAAVAAACNSTGGPTTAPTNAPATSAPATPGPTAGSPTGLDGGAGVVFTPKSGANPTVTGGAALTEADGKTLVVIAVVSTGTEALAASIQAGTCANLTPEIAYRLTDVTAGASSTTVTVPLATLTATPYAINISILGSETESSVACGEIMVVPAS